MTPDPPKRGRGNPGVPYRTKMQRVPVPILAQIRAIIKEYTQRVKNR